MTVLKAITRANELRPNTITDEQKAAWIAELESKIAEMTGIEFTDTFPIDYDLSIPIPYDNIYALYLVAMIDYYHAESALYQNDMEMFNSAYAEACAWWRRNNKPTSGGNFKVM